MTVLAKIMTASAGAATLLVISMNGARTQELSNSQVERGRYLATVGNCIGCHTDVENGGKPFAGGRGLETPFGTIFSKNLTPDNETGLGRWTKDEFFDAMTKGRGRDGEHLYPAFPYVYFTKMPREDIDAVYDYLRTLEPLSVEIPENKLPLPLRIRQAVAGWKMLFFEERTFVSDNEQSAEWNRGRYLVNGPAHCGACHTGKNFMGGDKDSEYLRGGVLEEWFAPNIRGGENGGISHWETDDIVEYLGTGRSKHTAPMQRMGEVVEFSTQHMVTADLEAIATYLKSLDDEPITNVETVEQTRLDAGEHIYLDSCAACHVSSGQGVSHIYAQLDGSNKVTAEDPATLIRIILEGAQAQQTDDFPGPIGMPAFNWKLDDDQIADLTSFLRQAWSNAAEPVTADTVKKMRNAVEEN